MRAIRLTALFLSLFASPLMSQSRGPATLNGVLTKEDATAIKGAFVLVRDYEKTSQNYVANKWETQTEANGKFSFVLQPGCYDIFISANTYFLPFSRRICIQGERSSMLKVKLKADPQLQGRLRQD
jgi:hypothetical protein